MWSSFTLTIENAKNCEPSRNGVIGFTTDLFWLLHFYTTGQTDLSESPHNNRRNSDEFLLAQGSSSNGGVESTTAAAFIPESSNYYPTLGDARAALLSMQNKKQLQESSSLWTGSDRYCESVLYGFWQHFQVYAVAKISTWFQNWELRIFTTSCCSSVKFVILCHVANGHFSWTFVTPGTKSTKPKCNDSWTCLYWLCSLDWSPGDVGKGRTRPLNGGGLDGSGGTQARHTPAFRGEVSFWASLYSNVAHVVSVSIKTPAH
jgi:hypothetical protein